MTKETAERKINLSNIIKPTVGKLICIIMAAYFVFMFVQLSRNKTVISYYEVEEGSIVKEHNYTGIILREEQIIDSEASGYVYYYVANGSKVAGGRRLYCIDEKGNLSSYMRDNAAENNALNASGIQSVRKYVMQRSRGYSDNSFKNVYSTKDNLDIKILEYAGMSVFGKLSDKLKSEGIKFSEFFAPATGTVCTYTDGYESLTEEELSSEFFNAEYVRHNIMPDDHIDAGTPVLKLITSEAYEIAFPLSSADVAEFKDRTELKISFKDKGFSTKADFRIMTTPKGEMFGILSLKSYLIHFTADRFAEFEIITNDVSGLKIPDKSITDKDFYIVPRECMHTDEDGNQGFFKAVISDTGTASKFVITDIINLDDAYCYIDCSEKTALQPGDFVLADSKADAEMIELAAKKPLKGVYNINKGYAVFKKVEILESSNGYSIVKKGSSYGLQVYDHIILDAATVTEGELLYS